MKIENVNCVNTSFEVDELKAMGKAFEVLKELVCEVGTEKILVSMDDGEVVGMSEIPRVCGILDSLCRHRAWEVSYGHFNGLG